MADAKINGYLVYRARDKQVRYVKKSPALDWDEVAFDVHVAVPDPWGRIAGSITIDLPESSPAVVVVDVKPAHPDEALSLEAAVLAIDQAIERRDAVLRSATSTDLERREADLAYRMAVATHDAIEARGAR